MYATGSDTIRNERRRMMWEEARLNWHPPARSRRTRPVVIGERIRSNELVILGADGIVRKARVYMTRRCRAKYAADLQEILNCEGESTLARIARIWYLGYVREGVAS